MGIKSKSITTNKIKLLNSLIPDCNDAKQKVEPPMTKLFLIPLILCLLWTLFLKANGLSLTQGKRGFIYIIAICGTLILLLMLLLWLTA